MKVNLKKKIIDASYTTTGCGFGLTALAMATEWTKGKTIEKIAKIKSSDIESLFEFPPMRKNYPESAVEAMQKAVSDYLNGTGVKPEDRVSRTSALEKLKSKGNLKNENLKQVILEGEKLEGIDFSGADLSNAFLQNGEFKGSIFRGSKLRGAFLNNCDLRNADLREADLRWCKLTGAQVDNALFENALYDIGTRFDPKNTHLLKVMQKVGKESYAMK